MGWAEATRCSLLPGLPLLWHLRAEHFAGRCLSLSPTPLSLPFVDGETNARRGRVTRSHTAASQAAELGLELRSLMTSLLPDLRAHTEHFPGPRYFLLILTEVLSVTRAPRAALTHLSPVAESLSLALCSCAARFPRSGSIARPRSLLIFVPLLLSCSFIRPWRRFPLEPSLWGDQLCPPFSLRGSCFPASFSWAVTFSSADFAHRGPFHNTGRGPGLRVSRVCPLPLV